MIAEILRPGVISPARFKGSAALIRMRSFLTGNLRVERSKPMASGRANCSPLTPPTK